MLEIRNISKTYRQGDVSFKALEDVSLTIDKGDIVGVIGVSGAGKSTLIRTVNLLERPDSGQILLKGVDLTTLPKRQLGKERKKIGMIFQHFNLLSSRTVFDNIALPLELDHRHKSEIHKKVYELLQIVGLEDKASAYPASLSGGQKQRVAIARALANDPDLLLCDEATSALDPQTTHAILRLLKDINKRLRITILLITHEMDVVKAICNQIAVIDRGRLVAKGTLQQLLSGDQHPIIDQFIHHDALDVPVEIEQKLHSEYGVGDSLIVEIQLRGTLALEILLTSFVEDHDLSYTILKADMEQIAGADFGRLLVKLKGEKESYDRIVHFFKQYDMKTSLKGYV